MKSREISIWLLLLSLAMILTQGAAHGKILSKSNTGESKIQNHLARSSKSKNHHSKTQQQFALPRKLIHRKTGNRSILKNRLIKIERDLSRQIKAHKREEDKARKLSNPYGEATITPLVINAPMAKPKEIQAESKVQKPVYFIPQILLPKRRKRLVMHHSMPMEAYTNHMLTNPAPAYLNWMLKNKHYQDWMENNPYAQSLMDDYSLMRDIDKAVPSKSIGGVF